MTTPGFTLKVVISLRGPAPKPSLRYVSAICNVWQPPHIERAIVVTIPLRSRETNVLCRRVNKCRFNRNKRDHRAAAEDTGTQIPRVAYYRHRAVK